MDEYHLTNVSNALNEIEGSQPQKVKSWLIAIDKLLTESGCKAKLTNDHRGGMIFNYHAKKAKTKVCRIDIGETMRGPGCRINIHGNHFAAPYSITNDFPETMIWTLKNSRGCRPCKDPRTCGELGKYFEFEHNGETHLCCSAGVWFYLDETTEFDWLEKWIINELRWAENDYLNYPIKKTLNEESSSSYMKRWRKRNTVSSDGVISIFEQTNKEQRLVKPPIDDALAYFMKGEESCKSLARLIEFVRGLDMEPLWKSKNRYDCRYNKGNVLYIRLEDIDDFNLSISAFYFERKNNLEPFINSLPDEKRTKFINIEQRHCIHCVEACDLSMEFKAKNKTHTLCPSGTFVYENPTQEQFDEIEWLINIGRDYINYKISSKVGK